MLATLFQSGCAGLTSAKGSSSSTDPAQVVPSISIQPASQTVTAGQAATFSVNASGTAPLRYQWRKNGNPISGATLATCAVPATTTSDSGSQFTVTVSNSTGSVTSNVATLTVNGAAAAPSITIQPAGLTTIAGQTATFSVSALGTAPLSYQWRKNGTSIGGATSATYTTAAIATSDSGSQFSVVISNSTGSVTSNAATLTVNAAALAPSITTQPASQTVTAGQAATFSVNASGNAPLSYRWTKNGATITGATAATYTTLATTTSDNGAQFAVAVSNNMGSTTSSAATLTVAAPPAQTVTVSQDTSNQVSIQWSSVPRAGSYQVLVDDAPNFMTPMISQTVSQTSLNLNIFDAGFAPGVTYYVRITPSGSQTTFRLNVQPWTESYLSYSYARASWNSTGRAWMSAHSGIDWNDATQSWVLNSSWSDASTNVAQDAYYTEYVARGAVNMGSVRNDLALLDELAAFYVAYEGRFTTVGAMRAMTQYDTSMLIYSGPDSTKTLIWVWLDGSTTYVRECALCNSQFYHPLARLLRIITTLPPSERTQAMQDFASWYAPVVTHDHLLRLLWGNNGAIINEIQHTPNYISDRDLWLIAGSAEILGANANDPNLVPLTPDEKSQLQNAVQIAVQALQTDYRTYYPATHNFQGTVVGSVSYFNGEYASSFSDYAYSGYTGKTFPQASDARIQPDASWDISHSYRVPVFLRSLYDNRKATGISFPSADEIQLVTSQLMYKNFQGNLALPLFNNYFDGSNGWFEVGYHGSYFAYPPAQYCDNSAHVGIYSEPCLTPGAVQGWGLIGFISWDLMELQHSLATLAWSQDVTKVTFRNRYYDYEKQYSARNSQGQTQYPLLLFFVLSDIPEKLQ
jgi:hypothetical protein